jgi:hypothetical protein
MILLIIYHVVKMNKTVILNATKLFSIVTNNSILTVNFVLIDCVVSRNNDVTVRPTKTRIVLM